MSSDPRSGEAIVCVPARNEAKHIGNLMTSLATQTVATAMDPLKVVIVSNNSDDGTVEIVRDFKSDPHLSIRLLEVTLPPDVAHAGTARRLAMDAGSDWFEADRCADGVLISTDADAVAPETWVAANLAALKQADLVGGRLVIAGDKKTPPLLAKLHSRIERYWAAVRALEDRIDPAEHDPAPRHGDHTGASLALRIALYRAVGGVPPLPVGEDNALVAAVVRHGGRVRHCPNVWIEVSAREAGRAAGGMAKEMARRRETVVDHAPYLLPCAASWRVRLERRSAWRAEWPFPGSAFPNAIAYVAHREASVPPGSAVHVPIDEAIADLEAMAAGAPV